MSSKINHVLITLDSLRWDVFKDTETPFLDSLGDWRKAYSHGTYTLPSHQAMLTGKLPTTFDYVPLYDTCALKKDEETNTVAKVSGTVWNISSPETQVKGKFPMEGSSLADCFNRLGYKTIGSGAVNWFNPKLDTTRFLMRDFKRVGFWGIRADKQINFAINEMYNSSYFLFLNFGETHFPFKHLGCTWQKEKPKTYFDGDSTLCYNRQKECLKYLDEQLRYLFRHIRNAQVVICADHGDCFGEDGLWGHSFYHEKVLEVPLLITEYI